MFNEGCFIYKLYAALYLTGVRYINIDLEAVKKYMNKLNYIIGDDEFEKLFSDNYLNYYNIISILDPLFATVENNLVVLNMGEELANLILDDSEKNYYMYLAGEIVSLVGPYVKEKKLYAFNK